MSVLNLQQLRALTVGEKVWVDAIQNGESLGLIKVTVSDVDMSDDRSPIRVSIPRSPLEVLGILNIVDGRSSSPRASEAFTYWVDNLEPFDDDEDLKIVVVDNPKTKKTEETSELPVDVEAPLVSYYGKICRNIKVANPNPDFAVIQDVDTGEVRIAYLDTSDVFVIKKEMIEEIKKLSN